MTLVIVKISSLIRITIEIFSSDIKKRNESVNIIILELLCPSHVVFQHLKKHKDPHLFPVQVNLIMKDHLIQAL